MNGRVQQRGQVPWPNRLHLQQQDCQPSQEAHSPMNCLICHLQSFQYDGFLSNSSSLKLVPPTVALSLTTSKGTAHPVILLPVARHFARKTYVPPLYGSFSLHLSDVDHECNNSDPDSLSDRWNCDVNVHSWRILGPTICSTQHCTMARAR